MASALRVHERTLRQAEQVAAKKLRSAATSVSQSDASSAMAPYVRHFDLADQGAVEDQRSIAGVRFGLSMIALRAYLMPSRHRFLMKHGRYRAPVPRSIETVPKTVCVTRERDWIPVRGPVQFRSLTIAPTARQLLGSTLAGITRSAIVEATFTHL